MTINRRIGALALVLLLGACAGSPTAPDPQVRQALAPTGKLRVGVYLGSPTSMVRDARSGEVRGVSVEVGQAFARHLGVPYEQVEFRRVPEIVDGLKAGTADFTITNATPARARDVNFSQTVLSIELGYLVPPGSPIASLAELDRAGLRVGVAQGSTSQGALPAILKNATIVAAPSVTAAVEMLAQRRLDAFATNKGILFEMSDSLPGSRVLAGGWGVENLAIAIPKGREQAMPQVRAFVDDAIAKGLVARAAERAGLRGTIAPAAQVPEKERIAQIVASPDRSAADRNNDVRRKPQAMLEFIGARPGMVALDLSAGGGYTTELIARAVGPAGRAYGQLPPQRDPAALNRRAANPALAHLVAVLRPFEDPVPPELAQGRLDLVTLMFNYHDFGHMGVDRARMNQAVFAALKPGGMYVIADHSGRPGTGISESGTLHRIEEAFLRREVEAAGFRLAAQGQFLRNPADPRDRNTPEPPQPKDEFVLKFIKP